jgi:hypothetical protein
MCDFATGVEKKYRWERKVRTLRPFFPEQHPAHNLKWATNSNTERWITNARQRSNSMSKAAKKESPMEEQMQAWMKFAEPGKEHEFIARLKGKWCAYSRFWMGPLSPPQEAEGVSENKLILGGRFLQSTYKGPTPFGPSFEGLSIDGYDRLGGEHIGVWMDSMGTMMMVFKFKGQVDESGTVREMISDHLDAVTQKPAQMKSKTTYIGTDEHLYEGFKQTEKGWEKTMEITYKRKK